MREDADLDVSSPLFTLMLVLVAVAVLARVWWARKQEQLLFQAVAERTGLTVGTGALAWLVGAPLKGVHRGVRVEVHPKHRDRNSRSEHWTRFVAYGAPTVVSLARQGIAMDLVQVIAGADHQTGDDGFDRAVLVRGDPLVLTAALDGESRQRFFRLLQQFPNTRVRDGQVVVEVPGTPADVREVVDHLDDIAALVTALSFSAAGTQERLARIVELDTFAPVRRRAAEALAQRTRLPVADEALKRALRDRAAEVRAVAARALGDADTMIRLVEGGDIAADVRADLVLRLGRGPHRARLASALPTLLEAPGDDAAAVRLAALQVVVGVDATLARQVLPRRAKSPDPQERAAVAAGLGALGDAGAERVLLLLLEDPVAVVRVAAARGLGLVGTLHAVPSLRAIAGAWLGNAEVASIAGAAIAQIEARHGPAEAGRVALVEDGGRLSLVGEGGEVAVVEALPPVTRSALRHTDRR